MSTQRLFRFSDHLQPSHDEPIRSVITESDDTVVVAWHVGPGQEIRPHVHPDGQDTWTVLMGAGDLASSTTTFMGTPRAMAFASPASSTALAWCAVIVMRLIWSARTGGAVAILRPLSRSCEGTSYSPRRNAVGVVPATLRKLAAKAEGVL